MAIFRCKMCGGDLEVTEGSSSCTCEFCGTKQTLPTITDEALQSLFNRANVLRMKSEFDKAADVYEKILQRSEQEAEAYWGLILCKYGIEYVEDPATFKRVPTCHRASYDAVTADEDYKNALRYADPARRSLYEAEAAAIDEIQRGIIALAQKEDPYDVFICYKETDESGKRTQDSVIANDIYHQLTMEGFKVFYAAITLEDKLGKEYEPYIFSALNTAKVMLALGTKPEYFSAVWVRNEWSRFLKIMKKDRSKLLIPCYRDMDPYELPEEFAHLQAQDMSKIGFISDLTRGIRKVLVKEPEQPKVQETVVVPQQAAPVSGTTAAAQIKRGNMALEDHEWEKADDFFEEALNLDPECAEAYIGKLLARDRKPGFASWVAMQKEKYSSASTEQLEACPDDTAHINEMCSQYALEEYLTADTIRKLYSYNNRTYPSALSSRRSQKVKQLAELKSDRLLARAQQYAKGETTKQLSDGLADITVILDQRIAKAQEEDKASIARAKAAYESGLKQADEEAATLRRDAEERQEAERKRVEAEQAAAAAANKRKMIIGAIAAAVIVAGIAVYIFVLQPMLKYNAAWQPGNYVTFGTYPQTKAGTDSTPIEWLVLDRDGSNALVISRYGLDAKPYNTEFVNMTWEKCSLRSWLNGTFMNNAFTQQEQAAILTTNVDNSKSQGYSGYNTNGGNNTQDQIFLLSYAEANKYFGVQHCSVSGAENNTKSRVEPTAYAIAQDAYTSGSNKTADGAAAGWWWLRSPGYYQYKAALVDYDGSHDSSGVSYDSGCVRPAFWINLESDIF